MAFEAMLAAYAMAVGFVTAGLFASFYQLVTARPAGLRLDLGGIAAGVFSIIVCVFIGPFVLMRGALADLRSHQPRPALFFAALGIAAAWSMCSGIVLLQFVLSTLKSIS